ncbi:hypothetical protein CDAR_366901 [Caerostris darwini]|uniref:Uncharacterized protein n=1 Tax=Caerostris darwini TaxID=1538125 RepID=A0AAV4N9W4_9ARAC|nr:hypothetical protein CDAR_366901 [Caerostris darwini]
MSSSGLVSGERKFSIERENGVFYPLGKGRKLRIFLGACQYLQRCMRQAPPRFPLTPIRRGSAKNIVCSFPSLFICPVEYSSEKLHSERLLSPSGPVSGERKFSIEREKGVFYPFGSKGENQDTLRKKITYGISGCGKRETFIFLFSNHVADGAEEGCCDRNSKQPLFYPLERKQIKYFPFSEENLPLVKRGSRQLPFRTKLFG